MTKREIHENNVRKELVKLYAIFFVLGISALVVLGVACKDPVKLFDDLSAIIVGRWGLEVAKVAVVALVAALILGTLASLAFVAKELFHMTNIRNYTLLENEYPGILEDADIPAEKKEDPIVFEFD